MFFEKMNLIKILMFTILITPSMLKASEQFPKNLENCFDKKVSTLLTLDGTSRAVVKRHFLKTIDPDMLGKRAYGGRNWVNFSQKEKEVALDLYFNILYTKGSSLTEGMKDARNTVILKRLADRPVVRRSSGNFHVVVKITLDNGKSIVAAVLLTKNCKVFDLGQGGFASRFVESGDVDRRMREVRNR
jgi:hypothetical protein